MTSNIQRAILLTALVLYSLVVFILDVISPVGIEVWVLNLPVVLVPVFLRSPRLVVVLSFAGSVMVLLGWVWSPPGNNPSSWDMLNRAMGLATIGLIAVLAIDIIRRSTQLDDALSGLQREMREHAATARALEQNEERLRLANEGAGMGTFDVNLETAYVVWSATYLRMLGYPATSSRETTSDLWQSCTHPDDLPRVLEARERACEDRTAYSIEYRIHRADNAGIAWLQVFGRYYYNEAGKAVRHLGVAFDISRRKELERKVLEREVLAIAAREQRQVGQELHDGVGQELTGLGLMAQSLAERLPEAATEKRIALRIITGLDSVHQRVRELSRGLIPVHVESRGLAAALHDLAARTTEASGISVTAECPDWVELPDHETATQLFRITQEAVSNALRHGRPRHVRLTLLTEPNGLRLRIKDDGIGLQEPPDQSQGLGLRIMQYRAGLIGGALQVSHAQGGGTVVSCTVPGRTEHDEEEFGHCVGQGQGPDRR
jgi:PAS domain S-box-containing protein